MQLLKRKDVHSVCPKTGKYHKRNRKYRWLMWIFPIAGLLSLIWFLIRVLPKPSRATYPCQRVAFPLASGFIAWVLGLVGSGAALKKAKLNFSRRRYILGLICVAVSVGAIWLAFAATGEKLLLAEPQPANQPTGVAKGIHPGRVVWVHDPDATDWKGPGDGHPWESSHTNPVRVRQMMSKALRELTGEGTDTAAWDKLFRYFNKTHGKGDAGYKRGEKIVIKVNFVGFIWTHGGVTPGNYNLETKRDYMNTSPQMLIALLRQLVNTVGVKESDIAIFDSLAYFANEYYDIFRKEFPNLRCIDHTGKFGRIKSKESSVRLYWSCNPKGNKPDYAPVCFAEADYIINFANLKAHTGAGVTLCAKNHYGSLIRWPAQKGYFDMHKNAFAKKTGIYRPLVDLMGHSHIGGKTVLYLIDGLFCGIHPIDMDRGPRRWKSYPFNGDWTSSLLASQDPVAIDSVGFDFLRAEYEEHPRKLGVDDFLHEAALADNPPSGTFYDPDHSGNVKRLASLGVHEHWNNPKDKQYSRNLGTGNGIELISMKEGQKRETRVGKKETEGKSVAAESTITGDNAASLKMPLGLKLKLPIEEMYYKGAFRQEGDGPLGKLRLAAEANLTVAPSQSWPVNAILQMKITQASQAGLDGKWIQVESKYLPEATNLPPVQMDQLGRYSGTYNPGQAPLSFISELWPLPPEPIDIGGQYIEQVSLKEQLSNFLFKGTRRITLEGTKVVNGAACAELKVETNLDVRAINDSNPPPLNVQVISDVTFDTETGWPLEAEQVATWSGKVRESQDRVRDFKWEMRWNLKRASSALAQASAKKQGVIAPGAKVKELAGVFKFTEGPAVDAGGNVFFTDQPNNRIHKWSVDDKLSIFHEKPGRANGLYFDKKGNLLACADLNNQLWSIDPKGKVTVLVKGYKGKKLNGPNDLWIDRKGGIYFTDPFYRRKYWSRGPMEQDGQHVYYLYPGRKKLIRVTEDLVTPNGIIGTPDGRKLYVADLGARKTYVYSINADGTLSNKKLFCSMGSDGMTIDNEGNIYLTGKGVTVFNKAGEKIEHIAIDEGWTANVCFGGRDMRTLFITAMDSLYAIKMRVKGVR
jgi:gluconolactonase